MEYQRAYMNVLFRSKILRIDDILVPCRTLYYSTRSRLLIIEVQSFRKSKSYESPKITTADRKQTPFAWH